MYTISEYSRYIQSNDLHKLIMIDTIVQSCQTSLIDTSLSSSRVKHHLPINYQSAYCDNTSMHATNLILSNYPFTETKSCFFIFLMAKYKNNTKQILITEQRKQKYILQNNQHTLLVTVGSSKDKGNRSVNNVLISRSLRRTLVALVHSYKKKNIT